MFVIRDCKVSTVLLQCFTIIAYPSFKLNSSLLFSLAMLPNEDIKYFNSISLYIYWSVCTHLPWSINFLYTNVFFQSVFFNTLCKVSKWISFTKVCFLSYGSLIFLPTVQYLKGQLNIPYLILLEYFPKSSILNLYVSPLILTYLADYALYWFIIPIVLYRFFEYAE